MRILKKPHIIIFLIVAVCCFVYAAFTNIWFLKLFKFMFILLLVALTVEALDNYLSK
ncbi:hypothetical protein [Enterococcus sp. AZ196]|uniref:hypothetical protein n=1 Tax=Enterococcus sp. AZ196 TaxID=2774659 RepID=UPI003D27D799